MGECLSPLEHDIRTPRILLYDTHRGGVGLSLKVFDSMYDFLHRTLDLIQRCSCEKGCLKCVLSLRCVEHNDDVSKEAAIMIMQLLLGLADIDEPDATGAVTTVPASILSPMDSLFGHGRHL